MNKSGIEWCDMTWNPVTGCWHDCPYCYARERVIRFQGYELDGQITTYNPYDGLAVLEEPLETSDKFGKRRRAAFPFGFDPTLYKYRLDEPTKNRNPKNIFVGSMCDLFGKWVPDEWIEHVFDTCKKAPWHRYMFLTKNPERYADLVEKGLLPDSDNLWFGSTATTQEMPFWWSDAHNTFVSVEPIHGPFDRVDVPAKKTGWFIIGAETGNRKDKVIPEREWINSIVENCRETGTVVFMKDSLKEVWGDELICEFPWEKSAWRPRLPTSSPPPPASRYSSRPITMRR